MCPVFALTLPCLKNGNGQREFDHAARSQAIMLKYFSVSAIAFSAAVPYNRKENGMQAANSEAKGVQRHAVLAANFLHRSVNGINSSLTFIPAIVSGVALQITRKRHMGRAGTRFAVLLLLLVKAL